MLLALRLPYRLQRAASLLLVSALSLCAIGRATADQRQGLSPRPLGQAVESRDSDRLSVSFVAAPLVPQTSTPQVHLTPQVEIRTDVFAGATTSVVSEECFTDGFTAMGDTLAALE